MSEGCFDIEHFPTSEAAVRMMGRISPIYDRAYVAKWIFQVMGAELDEVRRRYDELALQAFPETATWGLIYWEMRYGIEPDESIPLEIRRQEVLLRRGRSKNMTPMTPAELEKTLTVMTGRVVSVHENTAPYTFTVVINGRATGEGAIDVDYAAVRARINALKPSHLAYTMELDMTQQINLHFAAAMRVTRQLVISVGPQSSDNYLTDQDGARLTDELGRYLVL